MPCCCWSAALHRGGKQSERPDGGLFQGLIHRGVGSQKGVFRGGRVRQWGGETPMYRLVLGFAFKLSIY